MNVLVKLWFYMNEDITIVARMLEKNLGLNEFFYDDEDTWQWCISNNADGMTYDISRRHDCGKAMYDNPIGLYVKKNNCDPSDTEINSLGKEISKALKVKVYKGEVKYIEGNEFRFNSHECFDET